MSTAISLEGVVKSFGAVRALDGLDLEVGTGEIHGFLGPNGAGKSTTIRVLLGLLRTDGGTVTLLGGDPWSEAAALHRRLAYVPGDVSLWPKLTGGEVIDLLGGCAVAWTTAAGPSCSIGSSSTLRSGPGPTPRATGRRSRWSPRSPPGGAAAAGRADVGTRPAHGGGVPACVHEARRQGATVLLSSHILAEVEALCDRVSIIRDGRTVQTGTLSELRHLTRTTVIAETATPVPDLGEAPGVYTRRPTTTESPSTSTRTTSTQPSGLLAPPA